MESLVLTVVAPTRLIRKCGLLLLLVSLGALLMSPALVPIQRSGSVSPTDAVVFGVNMPLFDGNEQMLSNAGTRQILGSWHTPVIRMPFRTRLSDAIELQALNAIKAVGATPLVIIHGATDATATTDDMHLLSLVAQVFGTATVDVEFGNEEDLAGVNDVAYTNAWNATVPTLKAAYPTYRFMGPVNFRVNPAYIGFFVGHATPPPDIVSWHEYVCNTSMSTALCMSHIANWATHVANTNAAEMAAVGHTVPFMITEWNMDPNNDPRYLDATVIGPWTTTAITELESLIPAGLVGAQLYAADSHGGGFELIDGANNLTLEGQAFHAAISGLPSAPTPTATLPTAPSPSASSTATSIPIPSPVPTSTPGATGSGGANGNQSNASPSPSSGSGSSSSSSSHPTPGSSSSSSSSSGSHPTPGSSSSSSSSSSSGSHPTPGSSSSSRSSGPTGSATSPGARGTTASGNNQAVGYPSTAGTTPGATGAAGVPIGSGCDPNTGICAASSGNPAAVGSTSNGTANGGTAPQTRAQVVNGSPAAAPVGLGHGAQVALMAMAAALLVGVGLVPALIAQGSTRRRRRRGPGPFFDPRDYP